jgi:hypothetical protein
MHGDREPGDFVATRPPVETADVPAFTSPTTNAISEAQFKTLRSRSP